jgi:hypothetical protein
MHGKPQRRLEHILLLESDSEAQDHPRHKVGQLSSELNATALDEEIDDGPVERVSFGR